MRSNLKSADCNVSMFGILWKVGEKKRNLFEVFFFLWFTANERLIKMWILNEREVKKTRFQIIKWKSSFRFIGLFYFFFSLHTLSRKSFILDSSHSFYVNVVEWFDSRWLFFYSLISYILPRFIEVHLQLRIRRNHVK